jgi:hypothetical protein
MEHSKPSLKVSNFEIVSFYVLLLIVHFFKLKIPRFKVLCLKIATFEAKHYYD